MIYSRKLISFYSKNKLNMFGDIIAQDEDFYLPRETAHVSRAL